MRNIPSHRSWRFIHAAGKGIRVNHAGGIETIEKDASIRQAILLLLSTRPSERVMRPNYGCDLHKLVFAPNDETTAGLAIHYVKQAIDRWEPRIEILNLDAAQNPQIPERLDIRLEYRVRNRATTEQLIFPFSLID